MEIKIATRNGRGPDGWRGEVFVLTNPKGEQIVSQWWASRQEAEAARQTMLSQRGNAEPA